MEKPGSEPATHGSIRFIEVKSLSYNLAQRWIYELGGNMVLVLTKTIPEQGSDGAPPASGEPWDQ